MIPMMKRIKRFFPMIIMMGIIFAFSAMQGEESSDASGEILTKVVQLVEGLSKRNLSATDINNLHWLIRKLAHFSEYALFGWTVIYALTGILRKKWVACIFSEAFVFIYAMSDELHQYFVPGRYMSPVDVGIDSIGALVGIWMFALFHKDKKRRKKRTKKAAKA